jgi:hypothetical protein
MRQGVRRTLGVTDHNGQSQRPTCAIRAPQTPGYLSGEKKMTAETHFGSVKALPRSYSGLDQHNPEAGESGR